MRKEALNKDLLREIRKTKSRFISILLLVVIAVCFLFGLRMAAPDMEASMDSYLDQGKLMDAHVLSTLGLTDEDVEAVSKVEGTRLAEGFYTADALASPVGGGDAMTVKVLSCDQGMLNIPALSSGRLPEGPSEILVEPNLLGTLGLQIGDQITLDTGSGSYENCLKEKNFTIVGTGKSPLYVSLSRGTSTLGNGSVSAIVTLSKEAFDMDYYTDLYVLVEGAEALNAYDDAYEDLIEAYKDRLEDIRESREIARTEGLRADAQEELDDAWTEYNDAKAEADEKLADAWQELEDAREKLENGRKDYEDGKIKLEDAKKQLADGQVELANSKKKLDDGEAAYADGLKQYNRGKKQYEDGKKAYEDGLKQYEEGLAEFEKGEAAYNEGLLQYEEGEVAYADGVAQLEAMEQDYQNKKAQYEAGEIAYADGLAQYEEGRAQLEEQRPAYEEGKRQYEEGLAQVEQLKAQIGALGIPDELLEALLSDSLKQLEEGKAQLEAFEAAEAQLNAAQAELEASRAQLDEAKAGLETYADGLKEGKAKLKETRKMLDAAKEELEQKAGPIEEGRKKLEASKKELDSAKVQLKSSKQQLQDAKATLDSSRNQLDKGWSAYNEGLQELKDAKQQINDGITELDDAYMELTDGEQKYEDGLIEYEDAKADAEKELADAEVKLEDAQKEIDDIQDAQWYILDRTANTGFASYQQDADRMGKLAVLFPTVFFLVAALVCLTAMTRMVDEQRVEIGGLKALGYSKADISRKYVGYGLSASVIGGIIGLAIGATLIPLVIVTCWKVMYSFPGAVLSFKPLTALVCLLAAVACCTLAVLVAALNALRSTPATLMRPKAPDPGKRVWLERIPFIWNRLSFTRKVTVRNLFRYKKRFWMTVIGIAGCTGLMVAGFGLKDSIMDVIDLQYDEISTYTAVVYLDEDAEKEDTDVFYDKLKTDPAALAYAPVYMTNVTLESDTYNIGGTILSVEDPASLDGFWHFRERLGKKPVIMDMEGALLSEKTADLLGLKIGDTLTIVNGDDRGQVLISGIVENYIQHYVYLSDQCYTKAFGKAPKSNELLLNYDEAKASIQEFGADILGLDAVSGIYYLSDGKDHIRHQLDGVYPAVIIIILAAAALAFVVLFNLSSINITERQRELATLRVLGFRNNEMREYVFRENLILTLIGMALGIVLGKYFHAYLITTVEVELVMFGRSAHTLSYVLAIILTLLFALLVDLVASRRLTHIDMVESLKTVE